MWMHSKTTGKLKQICKYQVLKDWTKHPKFGLLEKELKTSQDSSASYFHVGGFCAAYIFQVLLVLVHVPPEKFYKNKR